MRMQSQLWVIQVKLTEKEIGKDLEKQKTNSRAKDLEESIGVEDRDILQP